MCTCLCVCVGMNIPISAHYVPNCTNIHNTLIVLKQLAAVHIDKMLVSHGLPIRKSAVEHGIISEKHSIISEQASWSRMTVAKLLNGFFLAILCVFSIVKGGKKSNTVEPQKLLMKPQNWGSPL